MTELPVFLLDAIWIPFSALRGHSQFCAVWSPDMAHTVDICFLPGQPEPFLLLPFRQQWQKKKSLGFYFKVPDQVRPIGIISLFYGQLIETLITSARSFPSNSQFSVWFHNQEQLPAHWALGNLDTTLEFCLPSSSLCLILGYNGSAWLGDKVEKYILEGRSQDWRWVKPSEGDCFHD